MSQVLRNFLSNALKFTPEGGSVTVTVRTEGCSLRVEVEDSGAGISSENIRRLFVEVVQFNANTLQGGGGTGLGLWICKKIIDMHGGVIGASSEGEGKGSVFFFAIPLRQETAELQDATRSAVEVCPGRDFDMSRIRANSVANRMNFEMKRYSTADSGNRQSFDPACDGNMISRGRSILEKISSRISSHRSVSKVAPDSCSIFPVSDGNSDISPTQLLLVDDSAMIRKITSLRLQNAGFSVVESADGEEAVKVMEDSISGRISKIDVIAIDNVR